MFNAYKREQQYFFNTHTREHICVFNAYKRGTAIFLHYIQKGNRYVCSIHTKGEQQYLFSTYKKGIDMCVQYMQKGNSNVCLVHTNGNSYSSLVHTNGNSNVCSIHTKREQKCLFNTYTRGKAMFILFVCLMVFNATFNNISAISWRSFSLVEKTTNLSQVTDKLDHIMLYTSPWSRFELTSSVVICTYCIEYLEHKQQLIKSNKYSTITYKRS